MSGNPSIRISHPHQQRQTPPRCSVSPAAASPMAIPKANEVIPPPLPPPVRIPDMTTGKDPGWQWGNDGSDFGRSSSVTQRSSLLGGGVARLADTRQEKEYEYPPHHAMDDVRRGSSLSTITGYRDREMYDGRTTPSDDGSRSRQSSNYRLHGERQLEQSTLKRSSNSYDKHLLSRIGGPNGHTTPKRTSLTSMQETAQLAHAEVERWNGPLRPLVMPDRRSSGMDSPASSRWPSSGTLSPGFMGFFDHVHPEHSRNNSLQMQSRTASLTCDDSMSRHGSYDLSQFQHDDSAEEGPMSHLNLQERSPGSDDLRGARAGTKRRASSPPRDLPRDDRASISSTSASEIFHRRSIFQGMGRDGPFNRYNSPFPRLPRLVRVMAPWPRPLVWRVSQAAPLASHPAVSLPVHSLPASSRSFDRHHSTLIPTRQTQIKAQ